MMQNYVLPLSVRADVQFESHAKLEAARKCRQVVFRCVQEHSTGGNEDWIAAWAT